MNLGIIDNTEPCTTWIVWLFILDTLRTKCHTQVAVSLFLHGALCVGISNTNTNRPFGKFKSYYSSVLGLMLIYKIYSVVGLDGVEGLQI
jgi:hypothetical protein